MRKIKVMIASMFGAIALVFACVFGTRIIAASTQPYVYLSLKNGQTYTVGTTSQSTITTSDDGTTITGNFKTSETFANEYFTTTASSGNMVCDGNGLKYQKTDCSMTFSTTDYAKVTIVLYDSDAARSMNVTNTNNLNVSVTGKGFSADTTEVTTTVSSEEYKYNYNAVASGNLITVTVNNCPATDFTISNGTANTVYIQSIKIQPYLTVTHNTNGGSSMDSVIVPNGDTYVPATEPTKDGYSFVGWYTNDGLTDEYDNTVALTDDLTLYAKWADANAVYNVTFMNGNVQYGDSISIPYDSNEEATIGALMPTNPSKVGYDFTGWYTKDGSNDDWGTKIESDTTIDSSMVSNKALTLYSKFNALATCVYSFGSGAISSTKQVEISDSITLKEVNKFGTDRTNTFNGNSMVNYCQCSEIDFVLRDKASVEIYATQTNTTTNVSNYGYYIKDSSNNIIANSGYTPVQKPNKNATVSTYQTIVLPAGSYKLLSPLGVLNIYGMKIDYTTAASATDMTPVKFEWQFDNDNNPTKVRFIGTLNGIEDLSKLSNMKVAMTIRNSYVDSNSKTQNVGYAGEISFTGVYKKVLGSGDTSKEIAVDGVYYTVCTLTGIDEMTYPTTHEWTASWTIEAKLQYTYNGVDYSIQSSTIKDF